MTLKTFILLCLLLLGAIGGAGAQTGYVRALLTGQSGNSVLLNSYVPQTGDINAVFSQSSGATVGTFGFITNAGMRVITGGIGNDVDYVSSTAVGQDAVDIGETIKVNSIPTTGASVAGFNFAYAGNHASLWQVRILQNGGALTFQLYKVVSSTNTLVWSSPISSAAAGMAAGTSYTLKITITGTSPNTTGHILYGLAGTTLQDISGAVALTGAQISGMKVGVEGYSDVGGTSDTTGFSIVNFFAGTTGYTGAFPSVSVTPVTPITPSISAIPARQFPVGALTRTTDGLLLRDSFADLGYWYIVNQTWVSDGARPCYVAYPTPVPLLSPLSIGSDAGGIREGHVMLMPSGRRYLWYGAGDGSGAGGGYPWRPQMAYSDDTGKTWTRTGSVVQLSDTSGSWAARDIGGYVAQSGGSYYLSVLDAASATAGIPGTPYTTSLYRAASPLGPWTFVSHAGPIGSVGSFDDATDSIASPPVFDIVTGVYHFWSSTRTAATTGTAWTFGHQTSPTAFGPFTKDGLGSVLNASVNAPTLSRPENPKVFYSTALSRWVIASNSVDPTSTFTDGNDFFFMPSFSDLSGASSNVYRVRSQRVSPMDSTLNGAGVTAAAVGLQSPFYTQSGTVVIDAAGRIPFNYDADPNSTAGGQHSGRDMRQGDWEPAAKSLRFNGTTADLAALPLAMANGTIEFALSIASGSGSVSLEARRTDSTNINLSANAYLVTFSLGGAVVLSKRVSGVVTTLSTSTPTLTGDINNQNLNVYRVRVLLAGSNLSVFVDGKQFCTASDAAFASGNSLGFSAANIDASIRLLTVRTADTVSVAANAPDGTAITLRGPGGIIAATGTTTSGAVTFTALHYPLTGVETGGTIYPVTDDIFGGDTYTLTLPSTATNIATGQIKRGR